MTKLNDTAIERFDEERDLPGVVALWQEAIGQQWPLSAEHIKTIITGAQAHHLLIRDGEEIIAFVATYQSLRGSDHVGHLALLLVTPQRQRQGLGSTLHDAALTYLREQQVSTVQLGSIYPRFWCGVPDDLQVMSFFERKGWQPEEPVYDMVRDLGDFTLPEKIVERMRQEGIRFATATPETIEALKQFEEREFYNWSKYFSQFAEMGDLQDLLIAFDGERVVGSLIMSSPHSHPQRTDVIWQGLLGENAGSIGSVGVAASERGRGIGIGIVAYACEILKQRGVRNCYIDWLVLTEFYGKLGYKIWRTYYPIWRTFDNKD
ncbi:GNAT family N-acetyltransferase [Ktedonospora formicarum]|uniref:N-acetyltransferase domain-containing protein n=1 Tax=Ktedonospora formicarum TaxID=2778364 RepID=A0A8J3MRK8_9CHLR|nr:GNAT family N-acetyltransferase [Ktedonospora formicarum]GHO42350.1 hypothetical protein KSX_05130 [Ktedonospora formicarum]